jgi:hypothetical protein
MELVDAYFRLGALLEMDRLNSCEKNPSDVQPETGQTEQGKKE